jgi:tetratricopeptide (TPR) repeat protein
MKKYRLLSIWLAATLLLSASSVAYAALPDELQQMILKGYMLRRQGDITGSETTYKQAIELAKQQGQNSLGYATAINMLAGLYTATSRESEAEKLYLEAIGILEKLDGAEAKALLMAAYDNLSGCYSHHGDPAKALEYNAKALKYFETQPNTSPVELAKCLNNRASILIAMQKYTEAKDTWLKCVDLVKDSPDESFKAVLLDNIALAYDRLGQKEKAYETRKEALKKFVKVYGPNHPEVAKCLSNLAAIAIELNSLSEAASYYEQMIDILRTAAGAQHPLTISAKQHYRALLEKMGRTAEVAALDKELASAPMKNADATGDEQVPPAWALHMTKAGQAHQSDRRSEAEAEAKLALEEGEKAKSKKAIMISDQLLAEIYQSEGKLDLAEQSAVKAVAVAGEIGADSMDMANAQNTLGLMELARGKFTEGEAALKKSLAIKEKRFGAGSVELTASQFNLASLYHEHGKLQEAEDLYRVVLAAREKAWGLDDPRTTKVLNNLAAVYGQRGKYDDEQALLQRAIDAEERKSGADSKNIVPFLNNMAMLDEARGKRDEAEKLLDRSMKLTEKYFGADSIDMARSLNNQGTLYLKAKKYDLAEPALKRSLAIKEKILGPDNHENAIVLNNLSVLYAEQNKYADAEKSARRALEITEKTLGPKNPTVSTSLNSLADIEFRAGNNAEAEKLYKRAIDIIETNFGADHPDLIVLLSNEAFVLAKMNRKEEAAKLLARAKAIQEKSGRKD